MKKKLVIGLLAMSMTTGLISGCGSKKPSAGDTQIEVEKIGDVAEGDNEKAAEFGVRLLKSCTDKENALISPFSILEAVSMAMNGADGNTRKEFEDVLGMSMDELNRFLNGYATDMPSNADNKFKTANGIWVKEDKNLKVEDSFMKVIHDYYGVEVKSNPDVDEINQWVEEKTDGMIKNLLSGLSPESMIVLVNAICFEGKWEMEFDANKTHEAEFTLEDGKVVNKDFMHSTENYYIEDEDVTGFVKMYKNKDYAFVALLPNEDLKIADYVNSLSGTKFIELVENKQETDVVVSIPKFSLDYETSMEQKLAELGIKDAFNREKADFTKMATYSDDNLYISKVAHKTHIDVDEEGTKAAAATAVVMELAGCAPMEDLKTVNLDRPFVYAIVDCKNNVPIFMGTMMDVSK